MFDIDHLSQWSIAIAAISATIIALGVIWKKAIHPVIHGANMLIDYAEFVHREATGQEGSMKAQITAIHSQMATIGMDARATHTQLDSITDQVEALDAVWSKWVFSHASEHAEIWRILATLGHDRRSEFGHEAKGGK